ncbi:MAG: hypothetical protein ACOX3R_07795 [Desulfitobacteriia bacterium]
MSPKNKKAFTPNKVSGMNVEGMGGTGEELNQPSAGNQPKISAKQLMKENAQGS